MAAVGSRYLLSYRREDSAGHAGRLGDHLLDRFGQGSLFMDVESIEAGVDFTAEIERAISSCEAVLVVIGPEWLDATGSDGRRRLDEPADFVRREVEAALASDVRVIPVLVGGATMPPETELPESIASLARRNALELQDRRWREDVDALVDELEGRGKATVGNLPVQPTPFLGRAHELAEMVDLLRRDDVRLLTLTGPGGTGKTRLAVQTASKLAHTYPGGAWFVGLAALTVPALVLAELAAVLEVQEGGDGSLITALAQRLSRARTLVVLDNLEQLLPDAAAPIAELSAAAPTVDLVVSSREPLHLAAEREYPVGTLAEEEAAGLFVERARAVRPDFAPRDDAERETIAGICDRLDRLPLAIELAAARVKLLPPAKLLERLDQRLPLLTGGARDAPERQQTLRATIAWSHDLLSDGERALFERLAVFPGGCTLEAAEAVTDADLDTLQSLVERNLVREQDGPDGEPRYVMLETIREFALERLEERPDAEELRRRLGGYLAAVAEAAEPELRGRDHAVWLDRLDAEHDNVRTALRWALDGADPDLGLRLIAVHSLVWALRRSLSEARRWLSEALERTPAVASRQRAVALMRAGVFAREQGEDAAALLEESIRYADEVGDLATQVHAMSNLCFVLPADRANQAVPLAEEAVRLARGTGDREVLAGVLNNLGEVYRGADETVAARAAYEESLAIARTTGHPMLALLLENLAEMAVQAGDLDRARVISAEALEKAEAVGDRAVVAFAVTTLGWVALGERSLDEADEHLGASLPILRDLGYRHACVTVLLGMAGTAAARGEVVRAVRLEAVAARFDETLLGHVLTVADSGIHLRYLDELRAATAPSIWETAGREGAAMSLEEGIEYALSG
jgi:predicted ATPase